MFKNSTENLGFAFILLGIVFAVRQELISAIGPILGTIGLIFVIRDYINIK